MRNKILVIAVLFFSVSCFAQENRVLIHTNYHLPIWKPYSKARLINPDSVGTRSSKVYGLGIDVLCFQKVNWRLLAGFNYRHIDYRFEDVVKYWSHSWNDHSLTHTANLIYNDPFDLVAVSNQFGNSLSVDYKLPSSTWLKHFVGFRMDFYWLEFYNANYVSTDLPTTYQDGTIGEPKITSDMSRKIFLSTTSATFQYRVHFPVGKILSLGLRAEIGANIYSNWNQFSRYLWGSFGIELGFGKVKKEE